MKEHSDFKACPACGFQFLPGTEACPECGAALVPPEEVKQESPPTRRQFIAVLDDIRWLLRVVVVLLILLLLATIIHR